jgi:hypothetical protein
MDNTFLLSLHNIMRWAVLLFALLALLTGLRGIGGKRDFTNGDKRTALYFLIACDIQLLLGLALYFLQGWYRNFSGGNMGGVMKDPVTRFWTIEHMVGMIIAIIVVHIGYAGTKGNRPHRSKFRRLFWCTLIALLIILVTIPWPFRQMGIARPWVPGMGV